MTYMVQCEQQLHQSCCYMTIYVVHIHSRTLDYCYRIRDPCVYYTKLDTRIAVHSSC